LIDLGEWRTNEITTSYDNAKLVVTQPIYYQKGLVMEKYLVPIAALLIAVNTLMGSGCQT